MKQKEINKAYPAIMRLIEFKLPIQKARSVYNIMKKIREHFDFALVEEKKYVADCHGVMNQNGTVSFSNTEELDVFQKLITELNESAIEWSDKPVVLTDNDIGDQTISVADIQSLEGFVIFE